MPTANADPLAWVRPLAWGASGALILLPLVLMKLTDPNAWAVSDLPFAFIFTAVAVLAFEAALRLPVAWAYRAGAALSVGTAALLVLGNLAIGFAGSEDNAINLLFFAPPALALVGSIAVGFRAYGLSIALAGVAAAQLLTGVVAYSKGYFTGPLTVTFAALWLASALLFLRASWLQKHPAFVG